MRKLQITEKKTEVAIGGVSSGRRGFILGAAALAAVPLSAIMSARPAFAHHGWPGFDTANLLYIAGTVSSEGVWGNPHSHFDITLDAELAPQTPDLEIPVDLQHPEDSIRVRAARA